MSNTSVSFKPSIRCDNVSEFGGSLRLSREVPEPKGHKSIKKCTSLSPPRKCFKHSEMMNESWLPLNLLP